MSDEEQKKIFAKNLNHYVDASGKPQREIADAIEVSPQTFNTWCQGIAYPRAGKLQKLADYFGINKSDLIDDHPFNKYYFDKRTASAAQKMYENRELRALYDVECDMGPDDLNALYAMALALKRKERGNDDDI